MNCVKLQEITLQSKCLGCFSCKKRRQHWQQSYSENPLVELLQCLELHKNYYKINSSKE